MLAPYSLNIQYVYMAIYMYIYLLALICKHINIKTYKYREIYIFKQIDIKYVIGSVIFYIYGVSKHSKYREYII